MHSLGVLTKRDRLAVDFTGEELLRKLDDFADPRLTDAACGERYGVPLRDRDRWDLPAARRALAVPFPALAVPLLYRPFDLRVVYDDPRLVARRNTRVLGHLSQPNLALVVGRQGAATGSESWDALCAAEGCVDQNYIRRGGGTVFPLYLYTDGVACPNFITAVLDAFPGTPEEILAYAYAVWHAPGFRRRYADLLATDFPHIPPVADAALFGTLARHGARLLDLHLLRTPVPPGEGCVVEYVRYSAAEQAVYVNRAQAFSGISPATWEHTIGGYQVLRHWLLARRGRSLTTEDAGRFRQAVDALVETQEIMRRIDGVIADAGGWPLA